MYVQRSQSESYTTILTTFEHSKVKKFPDTEPEMDVVKPPKLVVPNEGCNRLYALSESKQQEGKG